MKAIVVREDLPGRPLRWQDAPDPTMGPGDVLVGVHATALNRADLVQRAGRYPPPPGASDILGLELAGEILDIGRDVRTWRPGDRVCALLSGGGYAERAVVPHEMLMPWPRDWNADDAAALPEAFFTAYLNVFLEGALEPGERLLVHGGASGVGTAAIQLAVHAGADVYATAGTPDKVAACERLGARAADYRTRDFAEFVLEQTNGEGVDVILDMVGAPYLERNVTLLRTGGRLVVIATLGGGTGEIDLRALMAKRLLVKGSTLRARPLDEKVRIKNGLVERFWAAFDEGRIRPPIDRVYDIRQAEEAHAHMRENRNIGKIVLRVRQTDAHDDQKADSGV